MAPTAKKTAAKKTTAKKTTAKKTTAKKTPAKKTTAKKTTAKKTTAKKTTAKKTAAKKTTAKKAAVTLLSGGNPQIPKADGDAPVQAYIAAMPDWKNAIGRQIDSIINDTVPNVRKAVRWNTPFYGVAGQGWFLGMHCFTKYIKVSFHNGTSLTPLPPVAAKHPTVRYLHVTEDFDVEQFKKWVAQSASMPGEEIF